MKRKRYTEAPTAGLGVTAYAPAPLRNASRAGCVSIALPFARVHNHLRALPPRSARTSRGSIVHHLPGGIRLRESAGSIELLGEPRDEALEQLVTVAQQRFGTKRVTLLGTRGAQKRLAQLAEERGFDIVEERQR